MTRRQACLCVARGPTYSSTTTCIGITWTFSNDREMSMAVDQANAGEPAYSVGAVAANSLIDLLQPLIDASASDDAAKQLLAEIGWRAQALPVPLSTTRQALQSMFSPTQ